MMSLKYSAISFALLAYANKTSSSRFLQMFFHYSARNAGSNGTIADWTDSLNVNDFRAGGFSVVQDGEALQHPIVSAVT